MRTRLFAKLELGITVRIFAKLQKQQQEEKKHAIS